MTTATTDRELFEAASDALAHALTFIAGVFSARGYSPQVYERENVFLKINIVRRAIEDRLVEGQGR